MVALYDGSHSGIGAVIESYSGLVLDSVVASNYCHGCTLEPKRGDSDYDEWTQTRHGHKTQT